VEILKIEKPPGPDGQNYEQAWGQKLPVPPLSFRSYSRESYPESDLLSRKVFLVRKKRWKKS
jgi:hypothetical protein